MIVYLIDLNKKGGKLTEEGHYSEAIRFYEQARGIAEQYLEVTDDVRLAGEECCFD